MSKALVLLLVLGLAAATVAPAMAEPTEDAAFAAGSTSLGLLSQIAQVGDDAFSTMDLATALSGGGSPTQHYGPYASSSPDSSTCGNDWAQDTFDRHFTVRKTATTTFEVVEQFKSGSFATMAGPSPGGCDTNVGGTINSGVSGSMHGYLVITVTGAQTSPTPHLRPRRLVHHHHLHPEPLHGLGVHDWHVLFNYSAGGQGLFHGEWKNASCDRGGNQGDVASTSGPLGLRKSALCP